MSVHARWFIVGDHASCVIGAVMAPWNLFVTSRVSQRKVFRGCTHLYSIRLFCVDQIHRPDSDAEARYTPFTDSAMAVTAPEDAGSENVADFFQSAREMVK